MPLFSGPRKPLVSFSTRERASLVLPKSMPPRRRKSSKRKTTTRRRTRRRSGAASNKIRIVGGRIRLRVTGYPGLQALAPSALVRFIPTTKLRLAARRVLRSAGQAPRRKRRTTRKRKATSRK
jgi:hypothetical protein